MAGSPILVFSPGAQSRHAETSPAALGAALDAGAGGVEAAAWVTADGAVALHPSAHLGGLRRRPISEVLAGALPAAVPTLAAVLELCGPDRHVVLRCATEDIAAAAVAAAARAGHERVWLSHADWEELGRWRERWSDVRLLNPARVRALRHGAERRAAQLAEAGIDAVGLHQSDWSAGLVTLFHRFGRLAVASDAEHERMARELVRMGVDAVATEHVGRVAAAVGAKPLQEAERAQRPDPHEGAADEE